ncbi:MAG: hypothetical protein E5Y18_23340, partial [Mesorhizobium sp.]
MRLLLFKPGLAKTGLVILALPLLAGVVRADDCADAQDQATMNECAGKSFTEADKKLNHAYR